MDACIEQGLSISGINAEVMPAQWEYQIGPLGAPEVADQIWISGGSYIALLKNTVSPLPLLLSR